VLFFSNSLNRVFPLYSPLFVEIALSGLYKL
jgi:hypothetical protein